MITSIQFHYDESLPGKWKIFVTGAKTVDEAIEGYQRLVTWFQLHLIMAVEVNNIGHGLYEIKEVR